MIDHSLSGKRKENSIQNNWRASAINSVLLMRNGHQTAINSLSEQVVRLFISASSMMMKTFGHHWH